MEKRLYIILPLKVNVEKLTAFGPEPTVIQMEVGRLAAQAVHVGRKFERNYKPRSKKYEEITTITLSVRNSLELDKVQKELKAAGHKVHEFKDYNPEFYGTDERIKTALCIGPITQEEVMNEIGHLELFS